MNIVWQSRKTKKHVAPCGSWLLLGITFRSYYPCPHCPACVITLCVWSVPDGGFCEPIFVHLLVCLRRAVSKAIPLNQTLRQTDASQALIRCCLTSTQYGTCVLSVGLIAGFWTGSHTARLHRCQSRSGFFVYGLTIVWDRQAVQAFFFFSFAHMWEPFEHLECERLSVWIKDVFLCCFTVSACAESEPLLWGVAEPVSGLWACTDGCAPVGSLW